METVTCLPLYIIMSTANIKEISILGGVFAMKDTIFAGTVAGVIAGAAGLMFSYTLFLLGITPISSVHLAATLIVMDVINLSPGAVIFAVVTHLVVSSFFSIILTYVLLFTGKNFWLLKGGGFGALFCLVAHSFLIPLMRTDAQVRSLIFNTPSFGVMITTHTLIGLVAAFIIVKYHLSS